MPSFTPRSVWNPRENREAVESDQRLNAESQIASYNVQVHGWNNTPSIRTKDGVSCSSFSSGYTGYATLTQHENYFLRVNQTGHRVQVDDIVRFTNGINGVACCMETGPNYFIQKARYENSFSGITGFAYDIGSADNNFNMKLRGVNETTARDIEIKGIHYAKSYRYSTLTSLMRSGYTEPHYISGQLFMTNQFVSGASGQIRGEGQSIEFFHANYDVGPESDFIVENFTDLELAKNYGGSYTISENGITRNRRLNNNVDITGLLRKPTRRYDEKY